VGRPQVVLDPSEELLLRDLIEAGNTLPNIANELEISVPTLRKLISDIRDKEGILMNFRAIRSLRITELQAAALAKLTPDKVEKASLRDLVFCIKVLGDMEMELEGESPNKMQGLLAHLLELEKRRLALGPNQTLSDDDFTDVEYDDIPAPQVGSFEFPDEG